jgi:hypothetical protein
MSSASASKASCCVQATRRTSDMMILGPADRDIYARDRCTGHGCNGPQHHIALPGLWGRMATSLKFWIYTCRRRCIHASGCRHAQRPAGRLIWKCPHFLPTSFVLFTLGKNKALDTRAFHVTYVLSTWVHFTSVFFFGSHVKACMHTM